jgi:hypothetical protein
MSMGDTEVECKIHVTKDGSEPTCDSPVYTSPHFFEETQIDGRREVEIKVPTLSIRLSLSCLVVECRNSE